MMDHLEKAKREATGRRLDNAQTHALLSIAEDIRLMREYYAAPQRFLYNINVASVDEVLDAQS